MKLGTTIRRSALAVVMLGVCTAPYVSPRLALGEASVRPLALAAFFHDQSSASGRCDRGAARAAAGFEPSAPGRYPLFVYITGTTMRHDGPEAQALTRAMAERGFVGVSLQYENRTYAYCTGMQQKAHCLFGQEGTESALTALCARANVDCAAGVVVSGFSQGANLASLAKNFDTRVRGAFLMGHGHRAANFMDVTPCMKHDATALGEREVRSVNGEHDGFFGVTTDKVQAQLELVVGRHCDGPLCLGPDGSGYAVIKDGELKDGGADHCYFFHAADGRCAKFDGLDPAWEKGNAPWALKPSLDWLASRVRAK